MWSYILYVYKTCICLKWLQRTSIDLFHYHCNNLKVSKLDRQVQKDLKIDIQMKTCSLFPNMLQIFNDPKLLFTLWFSGIENEPERERACEWRRAREKVRDTERRQRETERSISRHLQARCIALFLEYVCIKYSS